VVSTGAGLEPVLGGSPKIQVRMGGFGFDYTYPTLTLISIQIRILKPYPKTRAYLRSRFNPRTG